DKRGNIFEGPRTRGYPMPPLRGTEFTERMATTARKLGWHAFPGPAAINSHTYDDRPACQYHGFCNRGGCHVNAKNSTAVSTIPKAMETKRLQVVTQAIATSVTCDDKSGRVTGVVYVKGGREYFQPADVVLLASYTYENVRLLLLSKSKAFPNELSNNAGQVGKHYMTHNTTWPVTALFPFDINNWYGLPAQGVAVDNWADDNFDHSGLDFIGGGNLWVYSDRRPIGAASMSTFGKAPTWGSGWKSFIKQNADRWNIAYLQKTTLPYEDNYLDLDPTVKDGLGLPVCRITADHKENEMKLGAFIQDKTAQWFMEAGGVAGGRGGGRHKGPPPPPFRGGGAHTPTLTAQALAWRTAEHLTKNWKAIARG